MEDGNACHILDLHSVRSSTKTDTKDRIQRQLFDFRRLWWGKQNQCPFTREI